MMSEEVRQLLLRLLAAEWREIDQERRKVKPGPLYDELLADQLLTELAQSQVRDA